MSILLILHPQSFPNRAACSTDWRLNHRSHSFDKITCEFIAMILLVRSWPYLGELYPHYIPTTSLLDLHHWTGATVYVLVSVPFHGFCYMTPFHGLKRLRDCICLLYIHMYIYIYIHCIKWHKLQYIQWHTYIYNYLFIIIIIYIYIYRYSYRYMT